MRQKEINDDLERYLGSKYSSDKKTFTIKVPFIGEGRDRASESGKREKAGLAESYDEGVEVEDFYEEGFKEEKKGGIFEWLSSIFKGKQEDEMENTLEEESFIPEEKNELSEDVQEVLKLSFKWLQELRPSKLREFKFSDDFKKYKEVLVKYGIAKEKQ